jgi:hypothetical protein
MALVQIFQDYERGIKYVMNIDFSKNSKYLGKAKMTDGNNGLALSRMTTENIRIKKPSINATHPIVSIAHQ